MKLRKVASLSALLSFLATIVTSVILYIEPEGRVAYWADWRLWGLSKEQWGALHTNLGFLFLAALCLHIYYNWKPMTSYLKDKARRLRLFTRDFNIALVIVAVCAAGTLWEVPPFSTILDIGAGFKDRAALKYGEPPYGHAELSTLKSLAKKMGLDAASAAEALKKAGFSGVDENRTLQEMARANGVSPQKIFLTMSAAPGLAMDKGAQHPALPPSPPPGTGSLTLSQFCINYGMDAERTMIFLEKQGLDATGGMTIKEIAAKNGTSPMDIYERLKEMGEEHAVPQP